MRSYISKTLIGAAIAITALPSNADYRVHAEGQSSIFFTTPRNYMFDEVNGVKRIVIGSSNESPPNFASADSDCSFGLQRARIFASGNLANAFQDMFAEDVVRFRVAGGGSAEVTFRLAIEGITTRTGSGIASAQASVSINGGLQITYNDFYQGSTYVHVDAQPYVMTVSDGQALTVRQRLRLQANPSGNESIEIDYSDTSRVSISTPPGVSVVSDSGAMYGQPVLSQPETVDVVEGTEFDGSLESLFASDDSSFCALNDEQSLACAMEFTSHVTTPAVENLTIRVESHATRLGLAQVVKSYNYATNSFNVVGGRIETAEDSVIDATMEADNYIDSAHGGTVRARVEWVPFNDEDAAQDGWLLCVDQLSWIAE